MSYDDDLIEVTRMGDPRRTYIARRAMGMQPDDSWLDEEEVRWTAVDIDRAAQDLRNQRLADQMLAQRMAKDHWPKAQYLDMALVLEAILRSHGGELMIAEHLMSNRRGELIISHDGEWWRVVTRDKHEGRWNPGVVAPAMLNKDDLDAYAVKLVDAGITKADLEKLPRLVSPAEAKAILAELVDHIETQLELRRAIEQEQEADKAKKEEDERRARIRELRARNAGKGRRRQ